MNCKYCSEIVYATSLCRRHYDIERYSCKRDKILAQRKLRRDTFGKDKVKLEKANHYVRHRTDILKKRREYQRTEIGKLVMNRKREKRRSAKRQLYESFTTKQWNEKLILSKGYCQSCNKYVGKSKLTLDHIIPISKASKGFTYTINDVQPLCVSCNSKKGASL